MAGNYHMSADYRVYLSGNCALSLPIFQHILKKEPIFFPDCLDHSFTFGISAHNLTHERVRRQRQVPVIASELGGKSMKSLVFRYEVAAAVLHGFHESVHESTFELPKDTFQDLFLTLEVPIKGTSSNSNCFGNLLDRCPSEPVRQEQPRAFPDYRFLHVTNIGIIHGYLLFLIDRSVHKCLQLTRNTVVNKILRDGVAIQLGGVSAVV